MRHQTENRETEEVDVESRGRGIILRSKKTFFCPGFQGAACRLPKRYLTQPRSRGLWRGWGSWACPLETISRDFSISSICESVNSPICSFGLRLGRAFSHVLTKKKKKKNLLTCRRLVIFRFCEKTLTNLFSQPVFAFSSSLPRPPLDGLGALALPPLRLFRICFANLGI